MRMKTALLITLVLPLTALADAATDLTARLKRLEAFQASFVQVSELSGGKRRETVNGELQVQKPDRFRWTVSTPYQQVIVSDGREVRTHDPDLMQMTIRKLDKTWGQTPALLFGGNATDLARQFTVTQTGQGSVTSYQLLPRAKDAMFASLVIGFREDAPESLELRDSLGQKTRIIFSKVRQNVPLAASLFTLQPPAGTDIIRE